MKAEQVLFPRVIASVLNPHSTNSCDGQKKGCIVNAKSLFTIAKSCKRNAIGLKQHSHVCNGMAQKDESHQMQLINYCSFIKR